MSKDSVKKPFKKKIIEILGWIISAAALYFVYQNAPSIALYIPEGIKNSSQPF